MFTINATEVRRDWSTVVDSVIRDKPKFIKRTHDYMLLSDIELIANLLSAYKFTAEQFIEDDGSVTLSLNEIDLVENGTDEKSARLKLAKSILDYAEDYYGEFNYWSSAPNRKPHIPYVLKALITGDCEMIGEMLECRATEI
ncbi:MAG: hypothetical protein LBN02_10500 [Oscillospiraceae bacterium]|jgi:hypothetical protein|nr:hypothetical protein [Oscillospiraceae bacterium]